SVLFVCFLLSLIGTGMSASANVLPAGTVLHVRTTEPIFSDSAWPGTRVRGVVDRRVTVGRRMVIPSGSPATVQVVSRRGNHVDLSVRSIRVGGTRYTLSTNDVRLGGSTGARRWQRGLVGAGTGAVVGGMAGGGRGAAIGGTAGAGMGVAT